MRSGGGDDSGAGRERARFEACFRENYARVLAFCLRRVSERGAAEDAAAETFAVVWRKREAIPEQPLSWLYAIARRVLANQRRSARRRGRLDERLAHEAGAAGSWVDPGGALAERDAFAVAFARLSEPEREALRLVAWDGLNTREAAQALGCSNAAFRVRLHRARRKLAKHLAAGGHSPSEGRSTTARPAEEAK